MADTEYNDYAQHIHKAIENARKVDPWHGTFKKTIDNKHQAVLQKIQEAQQVHKTNQQSFENSIGPLLATALGDIAADGTTSSFNPINVDHVGVQDQQYTDAAMRIIQKAASLVFVYDEICGRKEYESRHKKVIEAFESDMKATSTALNATKEEALYKIENMMADKHREVRAPRMSVSHDVGDREAAERDMGAMTDTLAMYMRALHHD